MRRASNTALPQRDGTDPPRHVRRSEAWVNSAAVVAVVVAALLAVAMQWPSEGERSAPPAKKRTTEPVATTPGPGGSAGRAPQRDDG